MALDGDRETVGIEEMTAAIHFRIDNAAPPVNIADIRWFFSSDLSTETPYEAGMMDITMVTTLPTGSLLSYAEDRTSLTISNISQSDEGRYFFMATNPAGSSFSHTDIIVHGQYQYHTHTYTHTHTWSHTHSLTHTLSHPHTLTHILTHSHHSKQ